MRKDLKTTNPSFIWRSAKKRGKTITFTVYSLNTNSWHREDKWASCRPLDASMRQTSYPQPVLGRGPYALNTNVTSAPFPVQIINVFEQQQCVWIWPGRGKILGASVFLCYLQQLISGSHTITKARRRIPSFCCCWPSVRLRRERFERTLQNICSDAKACRVWGMICLGIS
jgi:hypothetical protein